MKRATLLVLLIVSAAAADADSLSLKTERVVIFKDGYGLFMKKGTARADDGGRVYTDAVPRALLGTVWASSADGSPVAIRSELVESSRKNEEKFPAASMQDLLRANIGGVITLVLEKESLQGTLKQVIEPGADARETGERVISIVPEVANPALDPSNPYFVPAYSLVPAPTPVPPRSIGEAFAVIVARDNTTHVIAVRDIKSLSGSEVKTEAPLPGVETRRTKRLTFEFGAAAANKDVELNLLYLQEGIQWVPTYRLNGDLKETATMALQGELINEAEDITDAAVDLVVGVPNFKFNDRVSPLALDRELRRTLTAMDRINGNNAFSNRILNSQMAYAGGGDSTTPQPGINSFFDPAMDTQTGQDLFFYNAKDVSLKRGGRMTLPLWGSTVKVAHCYRFNIETGKLARQGNGGTSFRSSNFTESTTAPASPLEVNKNDVWHLLEMKNETQTPWTTGAALVLQNGLPISQDILAYTPPGGTGSLPITIAVDVRGEFRDEEISRQQNAYERGGTSYDLISKRGTITITNFRKEASKIQVNVSAGGKATAASDGGTIRMNDYRAADWAEGQGASINQHSDIRWEITLEPGAKKEITYTIDLYSR